MNLDENEYFEHYGTKRHSGRYPYGSGGDDETSGRDLDFLGTVASYRKQGLTDTEIATGLGMKTPDFRSRITTENERRKAERRFRAESLRDRGYSVSAIGREMNMPESTVRSLLKQQDADKKKISSAVADRLRSQIEEKKFLDVGLGTEYHMGISRQKLDAALRLLKDEGYRVDTVKVKNLGTRHETTIKVLSGPGTSYEDVIAAKNSASIQLISGHSPDAGRSFDDIQPPFSISSKRVQVRYGDEGGKNADGVIFVRPGVKDISLGQSRYAQVRIGIDGTHYLKGMAMYRNDLPPGVDLVFNTNKTSTGNKFDAMKPMKVDRDTGKIDMDDPFGAIIKRQIGIEDPKNPGKKLVTSAMNIVNAEHDWGEWSRTLSSQFLSKQPIPLAQKQLAQAARNKAEELEKILVMTNPTVREKLLMTFADDADSAAVHLKAAALPNQRTHAILPLQSMKETEVYAPNYNNGDRVVLVRFPHGGRFEIPELTVNNKNREGKELIGQHASDAIGIHHKVAERLSGADFDGDTVLVIPNNDRSIKTEPALKELRGFDPQALYKGYDGMPKMTAKIKGLEMGKISNLITDMTIAGAPFTDIARAVRHSMVVIDAEKHDLDYKRSAIDHGIAALKKEYQGRPDGKSGASTLISRARSEEAVLDRKPRRTAVGGPFDRRTGELAYDYSGKTYIRTKPKLRKDKKTGEMVEVGVTEKEVPVFSPKSTQLAETTDAHTLSSGTRIERVYADHSNYLKGLANQARLATVGVEKTPYSQEAARKYVAEVQRLNAALNLALRNSPLERQAMVIANGVVRRKRQSHPDLEKAEIKKLEAKAIATARLRTGAKKEHIKISEGEWAAIQAGAISPSKLKQILDNADMDVVKKLATPNVGVKMNAQTLAKANRLLGNGYTQAEVASALGISVTTLKRGLSGE